MQPRKSNSDTTHECPAPGCMKRVPFEQFACARHWHSLPANLQTDLWREFRRNFGEESYFETRAMCLRALGLSEAEVFEQNAGVR